LSSVIAARRILIVIPNYRLVPQAVYPDLVEDRRDAFRYVVASFGEVGDTSNILFAGLSAGGASLLFMFLSDELCFY